MTAASPCRGLIIGDLDDPHVAAVVDQCRAPGLVVTNAATLPHTLDRLDLATIRLRDVDGAPCTLHRKSGTVGWIRRLAPEDWDLDIVLGSRHAAVAGARLTLLGALLRDPSVRWLTGVDALFAAENKVVQLRAAAAAGLRIPDTVLTGDPADLTRLGEPFVIKPLGPGYYRDPHGPTQAVFATATTAAELAGVDLLDAPFLAQRRIPARRHARVVTVADRAWSCVLDADGLTLDWRRDPAAHDGFRHDPHLTSLAAAGVSPAASLGCGYTSQDWLLTDDGPVFLDLNPGGQWLFLPRDVGDAVTAALAARLRGET